MSGERILFVTGKLAEPALRAVLAELAPRAGFTAEVAVLPISVAALMTAEWVCRHLTIPAGIDRVILPGHCRGSLDQFAVPTQCGPIDLRDLPDYFGRSAGPPIGYGEYDIQIVAEINHAPRLSYEEILAKAQKYVADGADIVDVGCEPGRTWAELGEAVRLLRQAGIRVSVDSLNPTEIELALAAGAELVLSVNASNRANVREWKDRFGYFEVVAIPDDPDSGDGLAETLEVLTREGIAFRIDPILSPIGFGFATSLGRYIEARRRWPEAELFFGIGNITELTDVDSAGVNVVLAGFCQELGIRSVLTTEVINWASSSVRELDIARRLVYHSVRNRLPPKKLEQRLVMLRDTKLRTMGQSALEELAARVRDRNYRLFAEDGQLHIINGNMHLRGTDPFELFAELARRDEKLDASHAFYLGYELAKAVTALTLSKNYVQDVALDWGFLTRPEISHR